MKGFRRRSVKDKGGCVEVLKNIGRTRKGCGYVEQLEFKAKTIEDLRNRLKIMKSIKDLSGDLDISYETQTWKAKV